MAAVAVVCAGSMSIGIGPVIREFAEHTLVERLTAARKSFEHYLNSRYNTLESMAASVSTNSELSGVLEQADLDRETGNLCALDHRTHLDVDMVVLADADGAVVGASFDRMPSRKRLSDTPLIRQPLTGERYAGWYDDGTNMYLVASSPVMRRSHLAGVIVLGFAVGRDFVDEVRAALDVSVMVMRGPWPVAWSMEVKGFDTEGFAQHLDRQDEGTSAVVQVAVGGAERFVVLSRVGRKVQVALSKSAEELADLESYLWSWLGGFAVLAALIAMVVSHWISRRLANPMSELANAADSFASGNWNAVVNESSTDEMARLGRAFNQMTRRMRQLIEDARSKAELLQRQRNELEWANQAKDKFLVTASHELRTPITTIVSSSEILSRHGGGSDEATRREFLRMIEVESQRISALVDQFLDVSEIGTGAARFGLEEFDFVGALRGMVDAFRSGAGKDRPISIKTGLTVAPCVGDRARLMQIVEQLLDNIIKFTPQGSEVTIELGVRDGNFELRVADRGPGLEDDHARERIFERFMQGGDILTEKPPGVGLGLSLARDVARIHGGDLRCEANPGGGSVFVLTLPSRIPLAKG